MNARISLTSILIGFAFFWFTGFSGHDSTGVIEHENLDSLAHRFNEQIAKLTTPELERRKQVRREFQRRGYTNVLTDVLNQDGFSALISYAKIKAQIAYSLPHNRLYITMSIVQPERTDTRLPGFSGSPSQPWLVPLVEDWSFPADPWKKE